MSRRPAPRPSGARMMGEWFEAERAQGRQAPAAGLCPTHRARQPGRRGPAPQVCQVAEKVFAVHSADGRQELLARAGDGCAGRRPCRALHAFIMAMRGLYDGNANVMHARMGHRAWRQSGRLPPPLKKPAAGVWKRRLSPTVLPPRAMQAPGSSISPTPARSSTCWCGGTGQRGAETHASAEGAQCMRQIARMATDLCGCLAHASAMHAHLKGMAWNADAGGALVGACMHAGCCRLTHTPALLTSAPPSFRAA